MEPDTVNKFDFRVPVSPRVYTELVGWCGAEWVERYYRDMTQPLEANHGDDETISPRGEA